MVLFNFPFKSLPKKKKTKNPKFNKKGNYFALRIMYLILFNKGVRCVLFQNLIYSDFSLVIFFPTFTLKCL